MAILKAPLVALVGFLLLAVAYDPQLATNKEQPTTDNRQHITNDLQPTTDNEQPTTPLNKQLTAIAIAPTRAELLSAVEDYFSHGLSPSLAAQLQGPKGDKGDTGLMGIQGPSGFSIGAIYPTATNQNAGTIGGVTYFGAKELTSQTLTVSGTSTLASLAVTGGASIGGSLTAGTSTLGDTTLASLTVSGSSMWSAASISGNLEITGFASASRVFAGDVPAAQRSGVYNAPLVAYASTSTSNQLGISSSLFGSSDNSKALYIENYNIGRLQEYGIYSFVNPNTTTAFTAAGFFTDNPNTASASSMHYGVIGSARARNGPAGSYSVGGYFTAGMNIFGNPSLTLTKSVGLIANAVNDQNGTNNIFEGRYAGVVKYVLDGAGNVGIGTTSPDSKLDVAGNILASASAASVGLILNNLAEDDAKFTIQSTGTAGSVARLDFLGSASQTFMSISSSGYVGIGTTAPAANLSINGNSPILRIQDDNDANSYFMINDVSATQVNIKKVVNSGVALLDLRPEPVDGTSGATVRVFRATNTTGAASVQVYRADNSGNVNAQIAGNADTYFSIFSGNVGIGIATPKSKLSIVDNASGSVSSSSFSIRSLFSTGSIASISAVSLAGGSVFNITIPASSSINNPHGIMLIQTAAGTPIASWSMGGTLALRGRILSHGANSSCTGINAGGSGCLDYAESFPTTDGSLQAGEIVAVDPSIPSHVIRATSADIILGVISTDPAALIDNNAFKSGAEARASDGTVPVALAGRVPVRISLENGPILPGDRLSLSGTIPGTAVKAISAGTTIGIALESSDNCQPTTDHCSILVFVNLSYQSPDAQATPVDEPSLFARILDYLKDIVLTVRGVVADKVQTNKLQVEDGITIKDRVTGEYRCIQSQDGQIASLLGKCEDISPTLSPEPSTPIVPDQTPSETPSPSPAPSVDEAALEGHTIPTAETPAPIEIP